jgi:integrase
MASIVKRKRKGGTVYSVVYRDATGRQVWEAFDRKKEADARRAAVEHELARSGGAWVAPTRRTFAEVAEAWITRRAESLRPHTLANYRSVLDRHLLPAFGQKPVAAIRPSDVEALRTKLAQAGLGAGTITYAIVVARLIFGELVLDGELAANPAEYRRPGRRAGRPPMKITAPSAEEVDHLIAAARPDARPVLELAASTGLRRGELFRLRWQDVDFDARELHVGESKTDAGVRTVPMFGSARRILLEQKARSRFTRPTDYVFPTAVGTAVDAANWQRREFRYARRAAGLRESLGMHDLRHFAVSRLVAQDANILLVARIAGHSRPDVTLRVYSHLFREGLAEAAIRFDPLAPAAAAVAAAVS